MKIIILKYRVSHVFPEVITVAGRVGRRETGGGRGDMAVELIQHKEWCVGLGKGDGVNMCCVAPPSPFSLLLSPRSCYMFVESFVAWTTSFVCS